MQTSSVYTRDHLNYKLEISGSLTADMELTTGRGNVKKKI